MLGVFYLLHVIRFYERFVYMSLFVLYMLHKIFTNRDKLGVKDNKQGGKYKQRDYKTC
jgi:hypothetical protein